jgi:hypothetical protein
MSTERSLLQKERKRKERRRIRTTNKNNVLDKYIREDMEEKEETEEKGGNYKRQKKCGRW